MKNSYQLISCICITCKRPEFLHRALTCFFFQVYPYKEIVISYPESDCLTKDIVKKFQDVHQITVISIVRKNDESLGNARNSAIQECNGKYICVWDDDDWYHPDRLSVQFDSLFTAKKSFNACVLRSVILLDQTTKSAYLSFRYPWENTLMCRKEFILQNPYANSNKGEDTHIIKFLDAKNFIRHIDKSPHLYIYIFHGANTWDHEHYKHLIDKSSLLDASTTESIISAIS